MITGARKTKTQVNSSPLPGVNREEEFRRYLLVYGVITDIPWHADESEAFDVDAELMRQTVEDGLNRRGEIINTIPYEACEWKIDGTKLSFKDFSRDMFHKIRKFTLFEIINHNWRSIATIDSYIRQLARFFSAYKKSEPYAHLAYIHTSDIITFFEEKSDFALTSTCSILLALIRFYYFLKINYVKERLPVDIESLEAYYNEKKQEYADAKEPGRHPTIPDKVFYQLHFKMMTLIRNSHVPFNEKVTACVVLLFMWLGLRPKEILRLRRRCLVTKTEEGQTLYFYEYVSPKNKNRIQTVVLFPAALEALKKLEELQASRDNVFITDYLVQYWDHQVNEPEAYEAVLNAYNNLLVKYMAEELSVGYGELTKIERSGVVIYRPCFYAYRVHLCTYLIDHGCDERWVEAHLGHLSQTIRGRYYRMKEWRREETRKKVASIIPETKGLADAFVTSLQSRRPNVETSVSHSFAAQLISLINSNKR